MKTKSDCIDKPAVVVGLTSRSVRVEMEVNEACSGCVAKSVCGNGDNTEKRIVEIKTLTKDYSVGEKVTISIKKQTGYKAVILCYVLPFIVFVVVLAMCSVLNAGELVSGVASIFSIFIYYRILMSMRERIENKIEFTITKLH